MHILRRPFERRIAGGRETVSGARCRCCVHLRTVHSTDSIDLSELVSRVTSAFVMRGDQRIEDSVAAVVACGADMRYVSATLAAVLEQSVLPGIVMMADCSADDSSAGRLPFRTVLGGDADGSGVVSYGTSSDGSSQVVRRGISLVVTPAPRARSFSQCVSEAISASGVAERPGPVRFLWLLHDDSRPVGPRCLERLLDVKSNTPGADIVGVKQLDWDGAGLHSVGGYAYGHGTRSLVVDGEPDQQQYDDRQDVFAVSLAGALVPLTTLERFGGVDPWFGSFAEGNDFCRRVCLSGGRVVVAPGVAAAHRRARFEGVRSMRGDPVDELSPLNTLNERLLSSRRYRYTDVPFQWWPLLWVLDLFLSVFRAVLCLLRKHPYEAWCRISLPWRGWGDLSSAVRARKRVSAQTNVGKSGLRMLRATRRQVRQWRTRSRILRSDAQPLTLNPLARGHLHHRAVVRASCAAGMAFVAFVAVVAMRWDVLRGALAGGSLISSQLLPTAATMRMIMDAAGNWWYLGGVTGVAVPSTPWMWVWGAASLLCGGNPAAGLSLLFFVAAPVSALSMWALAGVFTRSDVVRVVGGLAWVSIGALMGAYQTANLPMLVVMMFLPAAFAFVFRAVGMYHTEDPRVPRASVQAAACAALAFIPVVASEPQMVVAVSLLLMVFIILVRDHRVMLLMIPLPAVAVVLPNLVYAVANVSSGGVRQLFSDVMIQDHLINGSPKALGLMRIMDRAFGLRLGSLAWMVEGSAGALRVLAVALLFLLVAIAVLALVLPFVLRVSRMMWMLVLVGVVLAMTSSRIAVASSSQGAVAGSVLPGVSLMMLGLLSCCCMVAGGAVRRFSQLSLPSSGRVGSNTGRSTISTTMRTILSLVLALTCGVWFIAGMGRDMGGSVSTTEEGIPIIASDYLSGNVSRRVLALRARNSSTVDIAVMCTARGDLVDSSPAVSALALSSTTDQATSVISESAARLLAGTDDSAISDIAAWGIGGIYVVADSSDSSASKAAERLATNITASDGVDVVVSDDAGVYYRVTDTIGSSVAHSVSSAESAKADVLRRLWLVVTGGMLILYCLVAMPLSSRLRKESV